MSDYTKNELALIDFQSDINKLFYYVGEEDDQIPFESLKTFEKYFGSTYTLQTSNPEYLDAFMVE